MTAVGLQPSRAPIHGLVEEFVTNGRILAQILRLNGLTIIAEDCRPDCSDELDEPVSEVVAIGLTERRLWSHVETARRET